MNHFPVIFLLNSPVDLFIYRLRQQELQTVQYRGCFCWPKQLSIQHKHICLTSNWLGLSGRTFCGTASKDFLK